MNDSIENQIKNLIKNDPDITDYQIISFGHVLGKKEEFESFLKNNPNFRDKVLNPTIGDFTVWDDIDNSSNYNNSFNMLNTKDIIDNSFDFDKKAKSAEDSADIFNSMESELEEVPIELPSGENIYKKDIEDATQRFINYFTTVNTKEAIKNNLNIDNVSKSAKDSYDVFFGNDLIPAEPSHDPNQALVPYEKPAENLVPYEKPVETLVPYEKPAETLVPVESELIDKPEPKKVTKNKGKWKKALVALTTAVIVLATVTCIANLFDKNKDKNKSDEPDLPPKTSNHDITEKTYDGIKLGDKVELKELKGMISSVDDQSISLLSKGEVGIDNLYANKFSIVSDSDNKIIKTSIESGKTEKALLKDYVKTIGNTAKNESLLINSIDNAGDENALNKIKSTLGIDVKVHVGADKEIANNNTAGNNPYAWEETNNLTK